MLSVHLGGCELGHSLGALRHSVLGQLSGEDEPDGSLDLARGHGGLLVVAGQLCCLGGNLLKDVSDEGIQDGDGTAGNSSVRVDLQGRHSSLTGCAFIVVAECCIRTFVSTFHADHSKCNRTM